MVRREEEALEPRDRHQGQVSPGKGRATTPVLIKTQQRSWHLDQGSTGQHPSSHHQRDKRGNLFPFLLRTGG